MDNKPFLILDIDGVCLDWMSGFIDFLKINLDNFDSSKVMNQYSYSLGERFGIDDNVVKSLMWDFHYSQEFSKLKPLTGAVEALAVLQNHYKFVAITACGDDEAIKTLREKNLLEVFGPVFEKVYCVDQFKDKEKFLSLYPPSVWVEDHSENSHLGLKFGHKCFLITEDFNKNNRLDSRIIRINDLRDLLEYLL
jgi:hypothetical protein